MATTSSNFSPCVRAGAPGRRAAQGHGQAQGAGGRGGGAARGAPRRYRPQSEVRSAQFRQWYAGNPATALLAVSVDSVRHKTHYSTLLYSLLNTLFYLQRDTVKKMKQK